MMLPASMGSATPVMYLAASEQRKSTASDTSLGSIHATFGRMLSPSKAPRTSSSPGFSTSGAKSSNVASLMTSGVRTVVGHTALTRMPCGPLLRQDLHESDHAVLGRRVM